MKRDNKHEYYKKFFDSNKSKLSSIWKGIRSIVNINNTSKNDIMLLNSKGEKVTDPRKIAKSFNDHYASVGPNIDKNSKIFKEVPCIPQEHTGK